MNTINDLPYEINLLEKTPIKTSKDILLPKTIPLENLDSLNPIFTLYHGIQDDLNHVKLESILDSKELLAKSPQDYISLIPFDDDINYDIYVKENISILVSPTVNAIATKCVNYEIWEKVRNRNTKQIYSYYENESVVKRNIPYEYFLGIGIPYHYYTVAKGTDFALDHLEYVYYLMNKYNIELPLVDTSERNQIIANTQIRKLIKK